MDRMRAFAWCLVVLGVVIAALSPLYAHYQSGANWEAWNESERRKDDLDSAAGRHQLVIDRINQRIAMIERGLVPTNTIASAGPSEVATCSA